MPSNQQTALFLRRLGALIELDGQARSRTRNFNDAADTIEKFPTTVVEDTLLDEKFRVGEEPGEELAVFLRTGSTPLYESLKDKYPVGLLNIVQIPRIGATRALALRDQLGVNDLDDLIKVASSGDIVQIKGIGAKSATTILKAAEALKASIAEAEAQQDAAQPATEADAQPEEPAGQAELPINHTIDPVSAQSLPNIEKARKDAIEALKEDEEASYTNKKQPSPEADDSAQRIRESLKDATEDSDREESKEAQLPTGDELTDDNDEAANFTSALRCTACHHETLDIIDGAPQCTNCGRRYGTEDDIIDMVGNAANATSPAQRLLETESYSSVYENVGRPLLTKLVTSRTLDESYALNTELMRIEPGLTIADIACGPGNFTRRFADAAYQADTPSTTIGVDMSMAMLKQARQQLGNQAGLHYLRADANHLPFKDNSLDRIHCAGALHLFNNPQTALREFVRVLKPGGLMVISAFEKNAALADLIPKLSGPAAILLFPALPAYFAVSAGASVADKLKDFSLKRLGIQWLDKGELTDLLKTLGAEVMMSSQEGMEITIQARKS